MVNYAKIFNGGVFNEILKSKVEKLIIKALLGFNKKIKNYCNENTKKSTYI